MNPSPEVAFALRQSTVAHQLGLIRRRYDEEPGLHEPLDEVEITRRLLALQDRLASHMRSRLLALTRDDAEALGALALAILVQTPVSFAQKAGAPAHAEAGSAGPQ